MRAVIALFAVCIATCLGPASADKKFVCYLSNWSQYRPEPGKYFPTDMDANLCTHIVYSFIEIGTNNELKLREWNGATLISQLVALKQQNPSLTVTAAVGGWNFGTTRFTAVVENQAIMQHFATTATKFLRKYNLDGLDMDWEYPGSRGSPAEDKEKFTTLLQILKSTFEEEARVSGKEQLLLTAAVAAGDATIESAYEIEQICQTLDLVHLMAYDFHGGSWEAFTGHNAPLKGNTATPDTANFNLESATDIWFEGGCTPEKMVLGIPTYGRTYTLVDPINDNGYNATASGPGEAGTFTREEGFLAYYEICPLIPNGQVIWNDDVAAPALVYGDQWISYDDVASVTIKAQYALDRGYGGAMVWASDDDDFQGDCGQGNYPLMNAIKKTLAGSSSPSTQQPSSSSSAPTTQAPSSGICSGGEAIVADPSSEDCSCFYTCSNGNAVSECCSTGLIFNADAGMCDWKFNYNCPSSTQAQTTTEAQTTTTTTTQAQTTTKATTTQAPATTQSSGDFTCSGKTDGNYADPSDCTVFHQCAGGQDYLKHCAAGLVFDGKVCNWPNADTQC